MVNKADKERELKITFARKIKRLADEGVEGEWDNAKAALSRYLQKEGLTMQDIADIPMQKYGIVTTKENIKFVRQVIASVIGQPNVRGRWMQGRTLMFKSTYPEYIEIKDRVKHFLKSYNDELEIFYSAFIQKNHLYANPDLADDKEEDNKPLTPEEKKRLWKTMQMMEGITTETYYKKIS